MSKSVFDKTDAKNDNRNEARLFRPLADTEKQNNNKNKTKTKRIVINTNKTGQHKTKQNKDICIRNI